MNFNKAKIVLGDAAFKLGGELFTREALLRINKINTENGVDSANEKQRLRKFVEKLFEADSSYDEKYDEYFELISAIGVLDEYEKFNG